MAQSSDNQDPASLIGEPVNADVVKSVLGRYWLPFSTVMFFSMVLNLLALAAPLYMIQVYDRVLTSRSLATLFAMFGLVSMIFAIQALLDFIRSRALWRLSMRIDRDLVDPVFTAELAGPLAQPGKGGGPTALRELETMRQFVSTPAMTLLFDVPWTPIYIGALFFLNYYLGLFAVIGAVLLAVLAVITELAIHRPQQVASGLQAQEQQLTAAIRQSAETVKALGMFETIGNVWKAKHQESLYHVSQATGRTTLLAAISRSTRLFLQSAILTVGAVLVINEQITAGMIIAATTLFSRAVQPLDQLIAQWRSITRARTASLEVSRLINEKGPFVRRTLLTEPTGHVVVDDLRAIAPNTQRMILKRAANGPGVSFELLPGEALGIVGPSGAGKTTIARVLAGIWPQSAMFGRVELDGVGIHKWDPLQFGRAIGYLPQEVNLIGGTVKQNIARFDPNANDQAINEAAILCGVHRMIAQLPDGYETDVGHLGSALSAGQRQRIGLARAVYGEPRLVILDEPNSNLDSIGEDALSAMMAYMKRRKCTVVIVSHRPDVLRLTDKLLVMGQGEPKVFGPAADVASKLAFINKRA